MGMRVPHALGAWARRRRFRRSHAAPATRLADAGQATIELVAVLPVLLLVALVVSNAVEFMGHCAALDRLAPQAVRVCAASPAYAQDAQDSRALVEAELASAFPNENVEVSVAVESVAGGLLEFRARLDFSPTLFGMGLRARMFGMELPSLSHTAVFAVDPYKPGVLA